MTTFATIDDLEMLWRPLKQDEEERAKKLLEVVSASLILEGKKVGKDLVELQLDEAMALTTKSVVVDIVARTLLTSTEKEPLKQESQSALGYTWSGTYLLPGGGIFIKDAELRKLGFKTQKYGVMNMYDLKGGTDD